MNLSYNTNWLTLLYDEKCVVDPANIIVLLAWNFTVFGGIWKGSIAREKYYDFVFQLADLSVMNRCLVYFNWDIDLSVEEIGCSFEQTNRIFYNGVLQPEAWHLDIMDKKINNKYAYVRTTNNTVDLWILDTGVNWRHREFLPGQVVDVDPSFTIQNITHPHGTGAASIAAGINYGTSKRVPIYSFPICRQGGSCASIWADQAFKRILQHLKSKPGRRSVINMSVGSYYGERGNVSALSQYYNAVFEELTANGAIIVVSAGNSNMDACNWVYSFSPFVISVGSIDRNFNKSGFSNWGNCVDIWAFGSNVPIAYSVSNNYTIQYKSGTSFSSPLVAGLIVNLLQRNPNLQRGEILKILYNRQNSYLVPNYVCGKEKPNCCQAYLKGSRLDDFCRNVPMDECPKVCKIDVC